MKRQYVTPAQPSGLPPPAKGLRRGARPVHWPIPQLPVWPVVVASVVGYFSIEQKTTQQAVKC